MNKTYAVLVDDNFHYMDPDARVCAGTFETPEAAIARAKEIVIESLASCWTPDISAEGLYSLYQQFGDDPFVLAPEGAPPVEFSAWNFARAMAEYMATLEERPAREGPRSWVDTTSLKPGP